LAVKCEDGGPVFYSQFRVGRGFHPFRLLKFRSMIVNADKAGLLTQPADARLTRVGQFLRKYKLDELPQLWNVLKGDMQLVGPRPEVARYVELFYEQYSPLLNESPGITDPASLAYRREESCFLPGDIDQQ
jgi:lipopolysaccharide/colanic/teichoic acid biosynthesis glycosyltransferase